MKKIKELQERSKLNEGRSFGIGFSILKPITRSKFETYLPFTACRDYLNDFTYVESTKKEIGEIHGYNHELLNCFENKRIFYLGVNTLHYNTNNKWRDFEDCEKKLISNYKNLEIIINRIEQNIGIKNTVISLDEDVLIFKAPIYWSKSTALISFYTLLIRCCFNLENTDGNIQDLIKNHKCFINADTMMKKEILEFLKLTDYKSLSNINYNDLLIESKSQVHNFGAASYLIKLKDKEANI